MLLRLLFLAAICTHYRSDAQDGPQPCPENPIVLTGTDFPQFVYSPYDERKRYPPNTDCRFVLSARNRHRRIHLTVIESELEEPLFTDCKDYVSVRDGEQATSNEIVRWCGVDHPQSLTSTGDSLFIHFHSDSVIQKRGFNLSFVDFDLPGCPPTWTAEKDGLNCYKLFLLPHGATWIDAQKACNLEQSNLLTIQGSSEYTYILDAFSNSHTFPWVGYTDAVNEGIFEPVDPSVDLWPPNFPTFNNDHESKDCVYFDWSQREDGMVYDIDDCRNRHPFICKKRQDGSTVAIAPSSKSIRRGYHTSSFNFTFLIAALVVLILLLIICFIGYVRFQKYRANNRIVNNDQNQRLVSGADGRISQAQSSQITQKATRTSTSANATSKVVAVEKNAYANKNNSTVANNKMAQRSHSEEAHVRHVDAGSEANSPRISLTPNQPGFIPEHGTGSPTGRDEGHGMANMAYVRDSEEGGWNRQQQLHVETSFTQADGAATTGGRNHVGALSFARESTMMTTPSHMDTATRARMRAKSFERPHVGVLDNVSAISLDEFWQKS